MRTPPHRTGGSVPAQHGLRSPGVGGIGEGGGDMDLLTTEATAKKRPWVANKPEDRLSIAVDRFLRRALVRPFYAAAIQDSDGGARTMQQRVRDSNRGRKKGQLDWDVVQGPPALCRKLELKRGKNDTSDSQEQSIADLTACGAPPVVAWTLRQVYDGLAGAGFRFTANVETVLQHCEELLAGWDREAEAVLSGDVVKKRTYRQPKVKPTSAQLFKVQALYAKGHRF